jgi:DNA-directed RNA polymerase subunit RPC12/RpoP
MTGHDATDGSLGIRCPKCGCVSTEVSNTYRGVRMNTRRRKCSGCDHRFLTEERVRGERRDTGSNIRHLSINELIEEWLKERGLVLAPAPHSDTITDGRKTADGKP